MARSLNIVSLMDIEKMREGVNYRTKKYGIFVNNLLDYFDNISVNEIKFRQIIKFVLQLQ